MLARQRKLRWLLLLGLALSSCAAEASLGDSPAADSTSAGVLPWRPPGRPAAGGSQRGRRPHFWARPTTAALPSVQFEPTPGFPFVFLHQRKCGGTSLRHMINKGAAAAGVPESQRVIPCMPGRARNDCRNGERPVVLEGMSVIAGHYSAAHVFSYSWRGTGNQRVGRERFACLTNFRDPVARVASCLFFRHPEFRKLVERGGGNVTREVVEGFMLAASDSNGRGCNNEAVRMLSGYGAEDDINTLGRNERLMHALVEQSLQQMAKCVVAILDPPERVLRRLRREMPDLPDNPNQLLFEHWLPWIPFDADTHENKGHTQAIGDGTWFADLVREHNRADFVLWRAALRQFEQQIRHAHSQRPQLASRRRPPSYWALQRLEPNGTAQALRSPPNGTAQAKPQT